MKPFPGKCEMTKGKVHRRVLNDEQREWFLHWFPITENARLSKAMGISEYKVHEFARELGLTKSEAGMRAIRKRRDRAAAKTNERNGCYDRKRGHPPSEATRQGNLRRWEETRQGLRDCPITTLKKRNPKKFKETYEKIRQTHQENFRKERLRMMYGLDRKTRLTIVLLNPYKPSQLAHRYSALRRGYLLDEDCSEGSPGRYVIYYDDETKRSAKFEENCIKDGFTFQRDE